MFDVIIVGGGPAGLSAALLLARCLRKIIVFDSGEYRNSSTERINGLLTRDGTHPEIFLKEARTELNKYGVKIIYKKVISSCTETDHFLVTTEDNEEFTCKKLLLATGIKDNVPDIPGFERLYGKKIFHCPYCDGFEHKGKRLAAFGNGANAYGLALSLLNWSQQVTLLTNKKVNLNKTAKELLLRNGIQMKHFAIKEVIDKSKGLEIVFSEGGNLIVDAIFFSGHFSHRSNLPVLMNCRLNSKGTVQTSRSQETNIPGLYVAGDAARDVQMVSVAIAEGTRAAIAINKVLQKESWK